MLRVLRQVGKMQVQLVNGWGASAPRLMAPSNFCISLRSFSQLAGSFPLHRMHALERRHDTMRPIAATAGESRYCVTVALRHTVASSIRQLILRWAAHTIWHPVRAQVLAKRRPRNSSSVAIAARRRSKSRVAALLAKPGTRGSPVPRKLCCCCAVPASDNEETWNCWGWNLQSWWVICACASLRSEVTGARRLEVVVITEPGAGGGGGAAAARTARSGFNSSGGQGWAQVPAASLACLHVLQSRWAAERTDECCLSHAVWSASSP